MRLASFSLRSTAQSNRGRVLPSFIDNAWTAASYATEIFCVASTLVLTPPALACAFIFIKSVHTA
jgi:hypothetical protein